MFKSNIHIKDHHIHFHCTFAFSDKPNMKTDFPIRFCTKLDQRLKVCLCSYTLMDESNSMLTVHAHWPCFHKA